MVRITITLLVLAALIMPAVRNVDSFPLSTYPMYSTARGETTVFTIAVGRDDAGRRVTLSLGLIGASDDPLIVAGELRAAVRSGRAEQRCEEIADRVSNEDGVARAVAVVEIASERHRTVEATAGRASLVDRVLHASCEVRGR